MRSRSLLLPARMYRGWSTPLSSRPFSVGLSRRCSGMGSGRLPPPLSPSSETPLGVALMSAVMGSWGSYEGVVIGVGRFRRAFGVKEVAAPSSCGRLPFRRRLRFQREACRSLTSASVRWWCAFGGDAIGRAGNAEVLLAWLAAVGPCTCAQGSPARSIAPSFVMRMAGGEVKRHAVSLETANATSPCAPQSVALHAIQTNIDVTLSALAHPSERATPNEVSARPVAAGMEAVAAADRCDDEEVAAGAAESSGLEGVGSGRVCWHWHSMVGLIAPSGGVDGSHGGLCSRSRESSHCDRGKSRRFRGFSRSLARGSGTLLLGSSSRRSCLLGEFGSEDGLLDGLDPLLLPPLRHGVVSRVPQPNESAPLFTNGGESSLNSPLRRVRLRVIREHIECSDNIDVVRPLVVCPFSHVAPPLLVRLRRRNSRRTLWPSEHTRACHGSPEPKRPKRPSDDARPIPHLSQTPRRSPD